MGIAAGHGGARTCSTHRVDLWPALILCCAGDTRCRGSVQEGMRVASGAVDQRRYCSASEAHTVVCAFELVE